MTIDPLVTAEWLNQRLGDPNVRPIDVRWYLTERGRGRAEYEAGHIPGAPYMDLDDELAAPRGQGPGRHPLPTPEQFAELAPLVDRIASVVGVDPRFLTRRDPRPTHVKAEGAHGAFQFEGAMIDEVMLRHARRVLERANG